MALPELSRHNCLVTSTEDGVADSWSFQDKGKHVAAKVGGNLQCNDGEVLTRGQIGVNDNFFDLGGHSLLATQAMTKLTQHFDLELPLRAIFESPTVAELAVAVEAARDSAAGTPTQVLTIQPFPREVFRARAFSRHDFEVPEILKKTNR